MSSAWTPEQVETLRRLWADGLSCSQISAEFNGQYSRNAVIGKVHRMKMAKRTFWVGTEGTKQRRTYPHHRKRPSVAPPELRAIDKRQRVSGAAAKSHVERAPDVVAPLRVAVALPSKRLTLLQLTPHACRYIENGEPPYTYCGHAAHPGSAYCEPHYQICINKVSASEANRRAAWAANWR